MEIRPEVAFQEAMEIINGLNREIVLERALRKQFEELCNELAQKNKELEDKIKEIEEK